MIFSGKIDEIENKIKKWDKDLTAQFVSQMLNHISYESTYKPTEEEIRENNLDTQVACHEFITKKFGLKEGYFWERGLYYYGDTAVSRVREDGSIWFNYHVRETTPGINILEPDVECRMIADFGAADENGNKPTNPYGALPRTEFISA